MTALRLGFVLAACTGLSACIGDPEINYSCDEPQLYQAITPGRKVESPEGLDPLNEYAEMPIPKAEDAPVRPPGSRCISLPPSIQSAG